jgi:hypothetical protein
MAAALAGDVEPPEFMRLREEDRPYWRAIVRARARDKWDELDLIHAVNLARTLADIDKLQFALDMDGHTTTNLKGTEVANPTHTIIETLTRRSVALSRALHVHAEAKQGKAKLQGKALESQRNAEHAVGGSDGDLIPQPAARH